MVIGRCGHETFGAMTNGRRAEQSCYKQQLINCLAYQFISSLPALLLSCQLHNADQLSCWCLHFISSNYLAYHEQEGFSLLEGANLDHVREHMWPPTSYEEAMEEYRKKYLEDTKEEGEDGKKRKQSKLSKFLRRSVATH